MIEQQNHLHDYLKANNQLSAAKHRLYKTEKYFKASSETLENRYISVIYIELHKMDIVRANQIPTFQQRTNWYQFDYHH